MLRSGNLNVISTFARKYSPFINSSFSWVLVGTFWCFHIFFELPHVLYTNWVSLLIFADDYRVFCGDLGNEANDDDVLTKPFSLFPSFNMARICSPISDVLHFFSGIVAFVSSDLSLEKSEQFCNFVCRKVGYDSVTFWLSCWLRYLSGI